MLPHIFDVLRSAASPKTRHAAQKTPPAPEPPKEPSGPPRHVEGRLEFRGMIWKPVLDVQDETKLVVAAKAGLPHCARCERALTLEAAPDERWTCPTCGRSHPGADADFFAADTVVAQELREFLSSHPDFAAAPALAAPKTA